MSESPSLLPDCVLPASPKTPQCQEHHASSTLLGPEGQRGLDHGHGGEGTDDGLNRAGGEGGLARTADAGMPTSLAE